MQKVSSHYKGIGLQPGAAGGPAGRNYALAIAIDEYAHCPRLHNCVKDARAFIEVLTDKYQFEPGDVITLFNAEATRPNIYNQFKELSRRVTPDDNLIVYFSGHGEADGQLGYWIPVNAHPGQEWEYFSTDDIRRRLDAIDSFHTFVIVDACFSGALFSTYKSVTPGYETKRSRWGLAASHSRERALDGTPGENSPFADTLLRHLRDSPDNLPVQDLAADVIRRVEAATEGRQTPVFKPLNVKGDDSGQYVFRLKVNEAADWKRCQETGTTAAYQAFLAKYPQGMYAQAARAALAELAEGDWEHARAVHTVASYNAYLDHHPAGPHANDALQRIKALEDDARWAEAERIGQIYGYRDYLRRFPGGRHQEEARQRIRQLEQPAYSASPSPGEVRKTAAPTPTAQPKEKPAPSPWRKHLLTGAGLLVLLLLGIWGAQRLMSRLDTPEAAPGQLEVFSSNGKYGYRYPSGEEAIAALYEAAGPFEDGLAKVTLDGQSFTIDTTGACVADCPGEKDKAAWAEAERIDDADAYRRYQQGFPQGLFYAEAEKRIKAFEAQQQQDEAVRLDQQGWAAAAAKDDIATYEAYQGAFPEGQYFQEAQQRIDELKSQQQQAEAVRKEDRAWQRAKSKNTVEAFEGYQSAYPEGKYYAEAGKRIRELEIVVEKPSVPNSKSSASPGEKTYRTVQINGLTWMAQNLDYEVPDSWCYDNDPANCRKYGRLYTWAAAKRACAALGWRLPTDAEWGALHDKFGGATGAYNALIDGGSTGFSALLGGGRYTGGSFDSLGGLGDYWSATEHGSDDAWHYYFHGLYSELRRYSGHKAFGFSCRCVQD